MSACYISTQMQSSMVKLLLTASSHSGEMLVWYIIQWSRDKSVVLLESEM